MTSQSALHHFAGRVQRLLPGPSADWAEADLLESDVFFNELALELFALQFQVNPMCKRLADACGRVPATVRHWSEIPAVPTAAFKDFEITGLAESDRVKVFCSSGTTRDRRSRHYHNAESLALYESSLLPWFARHMRAAPDGSKTPALVALTPSAAAAPQSSLAHMFATVARQLTWASTTFAGRVGSGEVWSCAEADLAVALDGAVAEERPVVLAGTAFSFVHWLEELDRLGKRRQLPPGSRLLETGGYKGRARALTKQELHECIRQYLGLPSCQVVCEYGMSELSSQAYDNVAGQSGPRRFRFPPWSRAVIVSPETGAEVNVGEAGLIRVIDLANLNSALVIQTEDLAVRQSEGFEFIGRVPEAEPRGCSLMVG